MDLGYPRIAEVVQADDLRGSKCALADLLVREMASSEFSMSNYVSQTRLALQDCQLTPRPVQQLGEPLGKGASAQVYSMSLAVPMVQAIR